MVRTERWPRARESHFCGSNAFFVPLTGYTNEEVRSIMSMVQKDVLRTDRTHKFYSGTEENGNIVKLFNVLVTYALNHPKVLPTSRD